MLCKSRGDCTQGLQFCLLPCLLPFWLVFFDFDFFFFISVNFTIQSIPRPSPNNYY